jgi:NADPH-dependent glutamate synthase beta subunit-like oxidoreductase
VERRVQQMRDEGHLPDGRLRRPHLDVEELKRDFDAVVLCIGSTILVIYQSGRG